ncbi:hypothetical protein [Alienimonas chondri]|uniref:Uncharacterized protein n=1 Tax=Alienimonas chondri TaxID=2681879 RepID=A0ABX1VBL2_9PLAN|nr:hypothetical protein [Alienimonas chondri]NNJ25494.1 hypothetical protein [Alienimonas chondri]
MAKFSDLRNVFPLLDSVKARTRDCVSLEEASGEVLDLLMEQFGESIVLTRLFATVAYGQLPSENQSFVRRLTTNKLAGALLTDDTPILSLMASRGVKPAWNDRRQSAGHLGIPLVSADFVDSIPMIARLLAEVGFEMDWLAADSGGIDVNTLSKMSGVFYVRDASSAVDDQGRKIISAQGFVRDAGVQTVFGLAGGFAIDKTFLAILFFCNETIERRQADQFLPLMSTVKASTVTVVADRALFA